MERRIFPAEILTYADFKVVVISYEDHKGQRGHQGPGKRKEVRSHCNPNIDLKPLREKLVVILFDGFY